MGWNDTWDDILQGGSPRWKVDNMEAKAIALRHIQDYSAGIEQLSIFCPLVGDDPFVYHAYQQGHSVTAADLVPAALEALRNQFDDGGSKWTSKEESDKVVWTHESGRVTLYESDILIPRPELNAKFDVVYDKDSFGALDKSMRKPFCQILADYTKDGGIVYTEVKNKPVDHPGRNAGPPYHVEKEDLMEAGNFGTFFQHVVALGKVYDIPIPGFTQTAHVLKRMKR